jgi:peptide/nickel transport system permease protein
MDHLSPGQLLWRRFRRNKAAVSGALLVVMTTVMALFCHLVVPDPTPDANRMSLPIGNRPPGFSVRMLLVRKNTSPPPTDLWTRLLVGKRDIFNSIPIDSFRVDGSYIVIRPYGGGTVIMPEQRVSLADAVWPLKDGEPVTLQGEVLRATAVDGRSMVATLDELAITVMQSQLVERRFLLGTDRYGRDMLSRLLVGTRVTFIVGLVAVLISLLVGVILGGLAGYFRGRTDSFVLWLINVVWSVPTLLLVIAITLVLGKGFAQVFIAVGLTMWVDVARIVRGQLFAVRELDFVAAGKSMGFTDSRILFRHMLPNIIGPVLVVAASNFSTAILLEAGLSFLGIGAQPPTPSWGSMIKENYGYIILPESAYLAILPGAAILLLTLSFTFVANGLRDALDSRKQLLG